MAIIDAGDLAAIEINHRTKNHASVGAITGSHRVLEEQAVGAAAAEVSGAGAAAVVESNRQHWQAASAVHRDNTIKLQREDQMIARAVNAIGRQAHLGDHRSIALVSGHIDEHRARRYRHSTAVVACHHGEGTQGTVACAVGIGDRGPIGFGAGIDLGIASRAIGRRSRQRGAEQERTTEQFSHLQNTDGAIRISHLALGRTVADQIAIADGDGLIF